MQFAPSVNSILVTVPKPGSPVNPIRAAIDAIHQIVQTHPAPYTLMVSGGVDSQAMLWAWLCSGVPFRIISGRFKDDLNEHDLVELKLFAERHRLHIEYVDMDVLSFLANDYDATATEYQCSSPQICTHIKIAENVSEGTTVLSGNFMTQNGPRVTHPMMALQRYATQSEKPVVPFFFLHTSELAHAFIPYLPWDLGTSDDVAYDQKVIAYQNAGFPVIPQPAKQTGFERIKELYDESHKHMVTIQHRLMYGNKPSARPMDLILRYPYERKFRDPIYMFDLR